MENHLLTTPAAKVILMCLFSPLPLQNFFTPEIPPEYMPFVTGVAAAVISALTREFIRSRRRMKKKKRKGPPGDPAQEEQKTSSGEEEVQKPEPGKKKKPSKT